MKWWTAIDFETSSTNKYTCDIVGVSVCDVNMNTGEIDSPVYLDLRENNHFKESIAIVQDRKIPIIFHNAAFDLFLLRERLGYKVTVPIHDTYLMAKHVTNLLPAYDLKSLGWFYLGITYPELSKIHEWFRQNKEVLGESLEFMDLSKPPKELVGPYCMKDSLVTAKLAHLFWPQVKDSYPYEIDRQLINNVVATEKRGICADLNYYKTFKRRGEARIRYNRKVAAKRMGTEKNPMGHALRDYIQALGETRKTLKGKNVRTDANTLKEWADKDEAVDNILQVRQDEKVLSTYVDNILLASSPVKAGIGVFHPNFLQSGAVTRRFRCAGFYSDTGQKTKGNTQNFPMSVREGIVPHPGYYLYCMDLASIEARMFSAFMSILMDEDTFAREYRKNPNFNPYLLVIERCTGHGKVSKAHELYTPYKHGTLGRLYGSSAKRFTIQLREDFELDYTYKDCETIYRNIDRHFPFISQFQRYLRALLLQQGYVLDPFGDKYYVPGEEAYKIVAYICQGAAANVLKWWWNEIVPEMAKHDDHIVNTEHDSLLCELKKKGNTMKRAEGYASVLKKLDIFGIPITAEVSKGKNWRECVE